MTIRLASKELLAQFERFRADIATLSMSEEVALILSSERAPSGCAVAILDQSTEVYLLLVGMVNPEEEIARLVRLRLKLEPSSAAYMYVRVGEVARKDPGRVGGTSEAHEWRAVRQGAQGRAGEEQADSGRAE